MDKSILRHIDGEDFIFDCRRVIYWPRRRILIAADLHWGKTQYLRSHGIGISDRVFDADLERLSEIYHQYDFKTFLVLGDLIHHEKAMTKGVVEKIAKFRNDFPFELVLIKGNHDRFSEFPPSWGIVEESYLPIDDFFFSHEYQPKRKEFQFAGHVHPMFRLRLGHDELRLPSFILGEDFCLLPAFSHLTGGQDVRLKRGEEAIVLLEDGVEAFKASR